MSVLGGKLLLPLLAPLLSLVLDVAVDGRGRLPFSFNIVVPAPADGNDAVGLDEDPMGRAVCSMAEGDDR